MPFSFEKIIKCKLHKHLKKYYSSIVSIQYPQIIQLLK